MVTDCDETAEKAGSIIPGIAVGDQWPFPDPFRATGSLVQQLEHVRSIRNAIKRKILEWLPSLQERQKTKPELSIHGRGASFFAPVLTSGQGDLNW